MKKTILSALTATTALLLITVSMAAASPPAPEEIMAKASDSYGGSTMEADITMILIDKRKNQRIRKIKHLSKNYEKDSKSVMFFLSPADVKNTAYLSHDWNNGEKEDNAWLYLPSLRKVKGIATADRAGSFMGSDFSYADLNGLELSDWNYKFARKKEQKVNGHDTWVIEAKPRPEKKAKVIKKTGYLKCKRWIRKDNFMTVKAQYWVKKGKKIKYYTASDIKKVNGIWTAHKMQMTTTKRKRTEHSTVLLLNEVKYNTPVEDTLFTTDKITKGYN